VATASAHRPLIGTRVTPLKKQRFAVLAANRGMTESRLLTLLVDTVLEHNPVAEEGIASAESPRDRVSLRLRPGDYARVAMRAATRSMKPASYLAALIHAHVRGVAPLPPSDLNGLKATVNQLAAASRCLQQIAQRDRVSDRDGELAACLRDTVQQVEALRQETANIVRSNLRSWEAGDA
jgi:hypothetical protein